MIGIRSAGDGRRTEELDELEVHVESMVGGRIRELRLELMDGGVVVYGFAHTYHAKQMAQHAVLKATNRPLLDNRIEVVPSTFANRNTQVASAMSSFE